MRHAILVLPSLVVIACSSGSAGTPTVGTPGGFGVPGSSIPALGPGGDQSGGDQIGPEDGGTLEDRDSGTVVVETGGVTSGDEAICAAKCPSDAATNPAIVKSCSDSMKAATCAAESRAFWTCRANKRVCTSEGTTNSASTQSACQTEQDALNKCAGG